LFHCLDIRLPSEQYSLDVLNKSCLELNSGDASVVGLVLGQSKVQLIDKSILSIKNCLLLVLSTISLNENPMDPEYHNIFS
jgi:hypothetical protein